MKKIIRLFLDIVEIHFNAIVFIALFMSMVVQVFMRYILDLPSPLLHEVMMYSFVWTVYLSAALAHRYDDHIKFNIIYEKLPKKVRVMLDLIFDVFVSILFLISLPPVFESLIRYGFIKAQISGISWTYLFMILPIFMILILIHNSFRIYRGLVFLIKGKEIPGEEKPWD